MSLPSRLLGELQRRSVVKVAAGYTVSAWLFIQVASIVIPAFGWPDWVMRATLIALVAGFPIACALAWAYQWTSIGIRREDEPEPFADGAPEHGVSERDHDVGLMGDSRIFGRLTSWEVGMVGLVMILALGVGLFSLSTADAARPQHIAVLPFRVVSEDLPGATLLAAGLMETLTSSITQFGQSEKGLWVVPAAEISDSMTPSAVRQQFGVSLIVSGSMQFTEQSIRLTLNLIDAATGRQIRSHQMNVGREKVIDLQDKATQQLARMLDISTSQMPMSAVLAHTNRDPEAVRLYMEGRGLLRGATSVSQIDAAIESLVRAVAIDSMYAIAAAGLGEAYWQKYRRTSDTRWVNAAIYQSQRALNIDSTLAPVWTTLGILRRDQQHDEAAMTAFRRAIEIDPDASDPYRHLAIVHRRRGDLGQAEVMYREAIARQPEYWKNYNVLGAFYYSQGRHADAVTEYTRGLRLAPANPSLLNNIAVAHWQREDLDQAISAFEKLIAIDPEHTAAISNLATAYFYTERFDEAADLYAQALKQSPEDHYVAGALADAQLWSANSADAAPETYRYAIQRAHRQLSVQSDPWAFMSLSTYYVRLNRLDSAEVWLNRLEETVDVDQTDAVMSFSIGTLYEALGDREAAWPWVQSALDRDYGWVALNRSPFLADFREDERVEAYRLRHAQSIDPGPEP